MELVIEHLFEQGVELFEEGDLKTALRFFREYIKQDGKEQDAAYRYLKLIGEQALRTGQVYRDRGYSHRFAELLELAVDAGGAAGAAAIHQQEEISSTGAPGRPKFRSPIPVHQANAIRLWRRPHMVLSKAARLSPGESFQVRLYADQSDPQPGEETQNIEIRETGALFYDLEVRLLVTAHFRLDGPATKPFRIEQAKTKTETVEFSLTVLDSRDFSRSCGQASIGLCGVPLSRSPSGQNYD